MTIKEFFIKNYKWFIGIIISIIGTIAVPLIIFFFQKKKKEKERSKNFKIEQKGNIKNSTFYQAESIVIEQTKLSVEDVKNIAQSVFKENFPKLKEEAENEVKKNVNLFIEELDRKITAKLNKEQINKFRDPDIQYALYEAIKINARKNSEELRKNLSTLIVERVENDNNDLKRIVYNEAIATVGKLTTNQLKILTLCFLLRYAYYTGIVSWETFNHHLDTRIKPFLDFKDTNAEFQHIEYAGCGSNSIGIWDLIQIFRTTYSLLFNNLIERLDIENLNLPILIKEDVINLSQKENKYFFKVKNKQDLEKYLKEKSIDTELKNKLLNIYESHIRGAPEVKEEMIKKTHLGAKLIELCENRNIEHLNLTSVGIVIAAIHYEQTVGEKINIDIWIN
jgi:hypothetical protein